MSPLQCRPDPSNSAPRRQAPLPGLALALALVAAPQAARAQWDGPPVQITFEGGDVWGFALAASGSIVHAAWGLGPVRYRRSTDEGQTWGPAVDLAATGRVHLEDPLVASGQRVFLAYIVNARDVNDWLGPRTVGDLVMRRSLDGGQTFLPEAVLTTGAQAFRLSLAVDADVVHLTWMDYRRGVWDVYYLRSTDAGASWEPERVIVAGVESFGSERPIIRANGASVHLAWMEGRDLHPPCYTIPSCPQTYVKRSLDAGQTWGPDVRLTDGPNYASRPNLGIVPPDTVIVSVDDDRDGNQGFEQYVVRSVDNGDTWLPAQRLTFAPYDSTHGFVIGEGGEAQLAWFDFRDSNDFSRTEVYFIASPDGGETWGAEENVSEAYGVSSTPLLARTDAFTHVAWIDNRSGSIQVWYRRRAASTCNDTDGDGYGDPGAASCRNGAQRDCNNTDAAINPGAFEVCGDTEDNDCDGLADCLDSECLVDADGDGVAAAPCGSDCDDGNARDFPGNTEDCADGGDNDCDGLADCLDSECVVDGDADDVAAAPCGNDCDDGNARDFPGNTEDCADGGDNDCDGLVDCLDTDCLTDGDADGVAAAPCGNDCDDGNQQNYPGNTEDCADGGDNDCDGLADCLDADCLIDGDADGVPAAPCGNDCNDADRLNFPGNTEGCADGGDNDCDGLADCADPDCGSDPGCGGADGDADGVADSVDNCVVTWNPSQDDGDADGIGNACDPDDEVLPTRVTRGAPPAQADIILTWPRTPADTGRPEYSHYNVYAGTIAALRQGTPAIPNWTHVRVSSTCIAAPTREFRHQVAGDLASYYYLVAGWSGTGEGAYGWSDKDPANVSGSGRVPRPATQPLPACP